MNRIVLNILNTLTFVIALVVNYLAANGKIAPGTVETVSDKYATLFTPADYTFSIWGWIYLWLGAFVGYRWYAHFKDIHDDDKGSGLWFALNMIANAAWIVAWVHEELALSVAIMLVILISLLVLMFRLRLEVWDAPLRIILFVWWPVCFYLGWIVVATLSNIAAWLVSLGWQGYPLEPGHWTIVLIVSATLVYLALIKTRNLREAAGVGVWGLIGIAVNQWNLYPEVAYSAIASAIALFAMIMYHGYQNRATSPVAKLKRGEW